MWNEQKSSRFQELRRRQEEGGLLEAEQTELERLIAEIEDAEAAYLAPDSPISDKRGNPRQAHCKLPPIRYFVGSSAADRRSYSSF